MRKAILSLKKSESSLRKMKINKLFVILIVMISSILLFSCKNTDTITINYVTNGGSNITSTNINASDISSYTLPKDPTLEGFTFNGWYIDQECTVPFESISEPRDLTLFAKWDKLSEDKSVNIDVSFDYSVNQTELIHKGTFKFFIENTSPKSFNDLRLYIDLRLKEVSNSLYNDEDISSLLKDFRLMIYIKESKLYLCIPGKLFPIGNIKLGNVFTSLDLVKFIEGLSDKIGNQFEHYFPRISNTDNLYNVSLETIISTLANDLSKYLNLLDYFGFDKELFNQLFTEFTSLISYFSSIDLKNIDPTEVKNIIINKLNELFDLFINNAYKTLPIIELVQKYRREPLFKVKIYDNHYFVNELPYYFDKVFNPISYKEDVNYLYGYVNDYGLYIPNYSNMYVFDTNNNFKEFKVSKRVTYEVDGRNVQVFYSYDGLSYMLDTGEIKPINTIKEYLGTDVLKAVSEADNVYTFNDFYYDKDYNLLDEKDIFEVLYLHDSVTKNYYKTIELLKNNFRINDITVNNDSSTIISIDSTYNDGKKDYNCIVNIDINSYKDSSFEPSVNPNYYVDFTNKIVDMIYEEISYYLIY